MHLGHRIQQALWDGRKGPVIFLSIGFLIAISMNLITEKVGELPAPWDWFFIALGPIVFFTATSRWWAALFAGGIETSVSEEPAGKRKGLVVLASPGPGIETAEVAIDHHLPVLELLWLVYSEGSPISSKSAALKLRNDLVERNRLSPDQIREIPMSDEDFANPEAVREAIENRVYSDLPPGFGQSDVIIDITGGLKTTTAGALLAGLPLGRKLQITRPVALDQRGRGTKAGSPREIAIDYKLKRIRPR